MKDYLKAKCLLLLFGWQCCPCWYGFARIIELFITDAFIDMFITICIVVNTVFMAMDHADMTEQMTKTLLYGNYVGSLSRPEQSNVQCVGVEVWSSVFHL